MRTMFHITKQENLESVIKQGLTIVPSRICAGKIFGSDYEPEGIYLTEEYQFLLANEGTYFGSSKLVVLEVNVEGLCLHEDEAYDYLKDILLYNPCYWTPSPIKPERIAKVIEVCKND